jgi:hypothetical protein
MTAKKSPRRPAPSARMTLDLSPDSYRLLKRIARAADISATQAMTVLVIWSQILRLPELKRAPKRRRK